MTLYIYSAAILLNSFSMTALMLVCGLAGNPALTADIAVVQGATLALFFAFSANARNVIFADPSGSASHLLLRTRLVLLLPMAVPCFILSSIIGSVNAALTIVLIARRSSEWIGEVYLSACEVQNDKRPALLTMGAECFTFLLAVILIFFVKTDPAAAMILWALAPLVAALAGRLVKEAAPVSLKKNLATLAPNLGSTTIIGIGVYVFRLSIIILTGRIIAGDLFTAFVIGGLIPTVYNSSIGPSLALRMDKGTAGSLLKIAVWFVPALFLSGVVVGLFSWVFPDYARLFNKSPHFWSAVGMSLTGGAIMIVALHRRILMLQRGMNVEIFGADVLSNVLIIVTVPYFYYLLGPRSLEGLYIFNAVLTLCFYGSAERTGRPVGGTRRWELAKLCGIAGLVVLPVFFQLSGNIFRDTTFIYDTGRILSHLPVPVSVIAIIAGVLVLGRYKEIHRSLTVFFFTAVMLVVATLIIQDPDARGARLILMAQYLMPFLGLVLGEMYGVASQEDEFEKTCLVIAGSIIPIQLIASWLQGLTILTPHLYVFSIYQHILYVPVVMTVSYGMSLICLWDLGGRWKKALIAALPIVAVYAAASYSLEVMAVFFGFIVVASLRRSLFSRRAAVFIMAVAVFAGVGYGIAVRTPVLKAASDSFAAMIERSDEKYRLTDIVLSPGDLSELVKRWEFYGEGIVSGVEQFLFGHAYPPDRVKHPSAHNYYLDLLYNFGLTCLLPLLALLVYSGFLTVRYRAFLLSDRYFLAAVVAVFVMFAIDNFLKVGLRQPYPGIFSFFVLGLLQARMSRLKVPLH